MKERINWIDWAKAWCMTVVVFCHLPQKEDTFYLQYLASVILSTFFFVSGYLKKKNISPKESLRKYGYSLLIPYFIYNAIYYPYWLAKYYIDQNGTITLGACLKPVIGTLLGQLNTDFSCELNGVTWFLLALFLMHWITDICNRSQYGKPIMLILTIVSIVLYGTNKYWHYAPFITYHGFVRCLCFFFLGNLFCQNVYLKNVHRKKDFIIGITALIFSFIIFYWHLHEDQFVIHIALFYVVNLLSVISFICICRYLDNIKYRLISLISMGTMLIFGLHRIMIGIIDYVFEKSLHLSNITYNWHEGLILTLIIELAFLPLIITAISHFKVLLGKK